LTRIAASQNYERFFLRKHGLVIHFDPYQSGLKRRRQGRSGHIGV